VHEKRVDLGLRRVAAARLEPAGGGDPRGHGVSECTTECKWAAEYFDRSYSL